MCIRKVRQTPAGFAVQSRVECEALETRCRRFCRFHGEWQCTFAPKALYVILLSSRVGQRLKKQQLVCSNSKSQQAALTLQQKVRRITKGPAPCRHQTILTAADGHDWHGRSKQAAFAGGSAASQKGVQEQGCNSGGFRQ